MVIVPIPEIKNVKGLTPDKIQRIYDYLQGAVYCWCKNRTNEWFSVRDLFGGENFNWTGTQMRKLCGKHKSKGKTHVSTIKDAGKDAGWILKRILDKEQRRFETKVEESIKKYYINYIDRQKFI